MPHMIEGEPAAAEEVGTWALRRWLTHPQGHSMAGKQTVMFFFVVISSLITGGEPFR